MANLSVGAGPGTAAHVNATSKIQRDRSGLTILRSEPAVTDLSEGIIVRTTGDDQVTIVGRVDRDRAAVASVGVARGNQRAGLVFGS